jgi:hypothetical protein
MNQDALTLLVLCPLAIGIPALTLVGLLWLGKWLTKNGPRIYAENKAVRIGGAILSGLFLAGILFVGVYSLVESAVENSSYRSMLEAHLSEYTDISNLKTVSHESFITGSIVIIDKAVNKIHPMTYEFYPKAKTPDDVGTIIWIDCTERVVGTYTSGSKAYKAACVVTVFDRAEAAVVGEETIEGPEPPKTKECCTDWHSIPNESIRQYISSLPRK